jgi:hypothetical protein
VCPRVHSCSGFESSAGKFCCLGLCARSVNRPSGSCFCFTDLLADFLVPVSRVGFCRGWFTRSRFRRHHCAKIFVCLSFSRLCVPCALVSQCALGQVLVSSRARGLFFSLPVSIFAGLYSICVLPKVFDCIFLPRLSSLLSFWFLLSDVQGVPFPNQACRSGLRPGCPVLNLCR